MRCYQAWPPQQPTEPQNHAPSTPTKQIAELQTLRLPTYLILPTNNSLPTYLPPHTSQLRETSPLQSPDFHFPSPSSWPNSYEPRSSAPPSKSHPGTRGTPQSNQQDKNERRLEDSSSATTMLIVSSADTLISNRWEWAPLAWSGMFPTLSSPMRWQPETLDSWCVVLIDAPTVNSSAKDNLTSTSVAVKKIMKPFSTPVLSKRTYRELKLLKHLKHENVGFCLRRHYRNLGS